MAPRFFARRRSIFGRAAVIFAAWLVIVAGWHVASASAAPGLPYGCVNVASGPLCPADRDLVVRVQQASLWETPAGDLAQTRSVSDKVKKAGAQISSDHKYLSKVSVDLGAQLGITVPNVPSRAQQGWLAQLQTDYGPKFDQDFANLLRQAHGVVFTAIAAVRSGTRNDLIRSFAETSNEYVMRHMQLLEGTGLVAYQALPMPAMPQTVTSYNNPAPGFVWAMLIAGVVLTFVAVVMMIRHGRPRRRAASW